MLSKHQSPESVQDNCSELISHDGSVMCMFLSPNTTALIQLMDQGVLQAMKNRYERKLLQKVICAVNLNETQNIKDVLKLHTVYASRCLWGEASPESICKAYKKLKLHPYNSQANSAKSNEHHFAKSMFEMFQQFQRPENEVSLNTHDLEDWLNVDSEL